MRRDVYLSNDSGGLSVVAADALDAIIEDERSDDEQFVRSHRVLLLGLRGDDSLPVRVVVDEPLTPQEEAEWLARVRWHLEVPDGRLLVAGGFDPDVFADWRDNGEHGGVAPFEIPPGRWALDVCTYVGSMNGNMLVEQSDRPIGEWFRSSHPGQALPLWLARLLRFERGKDPGHDEDWRDVRAALAAKRLALDLEHRGYAGFVFHLTRSDRPDEPSPEGGWFEPDAGARRLDVCPAGLVAAVEDPDLASLAREWGGEPEPERIAPPDTGPILEIFARFPGLQSRPLTDGGKVSLPLSSAWLAWVVAGLCSDGTPRPEILVELPRKAVWQAGEADGLRIERMTRGARIGVTQGSGGWGLWTAMSRLGGALAGLPDGATIDMAFAPRVDEGDPDDMAGPGRALFGGPVRDGQWHLDTAHPALPAERLAEAIGFARELLEEHRLVARTPGEAAALDRAMEEWGDLVGDDARREGDSVVFTLDDIRTAVLVATPVFRARFAGVFAMDEED